MLKSKIRLCIEVSGVSREEISKRMGISRNQLSNYSSGKSFPSMERAFQLSRILGVTVEDLYEYKEDKNED
ncbi:helix-turn-helix transcriptional regulator [Bacillus sp. BGMRC 2118]|nr:helix-turn-helix transcriptional regulator [Bacillus sp. BGMRC 2118]